MNNYAQNSTNDFQNNPENQEETKAFVENQPHSGFGIASFIISIFATLIMLVTLIISAVRLAENPRILDETESFAVMIGLVFIFGFFMLLVSIGLGIAGLYQLNRRKVFSALGIIISSVVFVGFVVLTIIGNMME